MWLVLRMTYGPISATGRIFLFTMFGAVQNIQTESSWLFWLLEGKTTEVSQNMAPSTQWQSTTSQMTSTTLLQKPKSPMATIVTSTPFRSALFLDCRVYSGNFIPMFWNNLTVPSSSVQKSTKKVGNTSVCGLYRERCGQWLVLS